METIVYGRQVCLHVLQKHKELIMEIYLGKEIKSDEFHAFASLNKPILRKDPKKMQALCKGGNHQGYILKIRYNTQYDFNFLKGCSRIIFIIGATDVGNIGSIFRSAYGLGIDCIVCSNSFNLSGVARSSSGAFFDMPFILCKDYLSLINDLKMNGFTLYGSSMSGSDIRDVDIHDKWVLFLGSEGEGLPNRVIKKMDYILSVKMKNFDSLNVAVAAGILIYGMVK